MAIKVSSAKAKGRNLQYSICKKIADLFNIEFNQQDDLCLIHSREMGQPGKDIIIRQPIYDKFKFAIECKSSETFSFKDTIEQVKANTKQDEDWLIFHKRKCFKNPLVIMDSETFFKLYQQILNDK